MKIYNPLEKGFIPIENIFYRLKLDEALERQRIEKKPWLLQSSEDFTLYFDPDLTKDIENMRLENHEWSNIRDNIPENRDVRYGTTNLYNKMREILNVIYWLSTKNIRTYSEYAELSYRLLRDKFNFPDSEHHVHSLMEEIINNGNYDTCGTIFYIRDHSKLDKGIKVSIKYHAKSGRKFYTLFPDEFPSLKEDFEGKLKLWITDDLQIAT